MIQALCRRSLWAPLLVVLCIAIVPPSVRASSNIGFRYEWVLLGGSPEGNDRPYAIDVDSHGNPIVAGMLQYNATFGDFVLDLNRKRSAFASKVHHASGQPLWVNTQVPEMDGTASAVDIAVDGEDNIVVMGTFKGNMQLGDVSLVANTQYGSVFLAHYHRNGTLLWAKEVNGTGSALVWGCAIAIEPLQGSVYLGGYFGQQVSFSGKYLSSEAVQMFIAKYNLTTGALQWVTNGLPTTGTTLPSYATDIALQFQNPFVVGTFFEYIQLGNLTLNTTSGTRGIYMAHFDSTTGEATSARSINGTGICYNFHQVDTDPEGNHIVIGCFTTSIALSENVTINGSAIGNVYIVKYDSKGALLWASYINSLATKYYTAAVCTDTLGNVYVAGYYAGVLRLNGSVIHYSKDTGIYVLKLSPNGTRIWSDVMPGSFGVQKMAAYGNDTVYLTGSFRGEATVGDNYIYSLEEEIFLFKITTYDIPGNVPEPPDGLSYKLGVPLLVAMSAALAFFVVWQHRRDAAAERVAYEEMHH